jgi:acyl carrier protein
MIPSSRTPEGEPNYCPVCKSLISIEPSHPPGDAPCPNCGQLLWFGETSSGVRCYDREAVTGILERLRRILAERLALSPNDVTWSAPFAKDVGADSLDLVELVMELEAEFDIPIPEDALERIKTVGDAIDYIERHLPSRGK